MEGSHIGQFYRNRSVLVTGGTGFLGKSLIEKLLRSCPDIDKIFVLLRTNSGDKVEDRIQEIVNTPVFKTLKQTSAQQLKKLVPINGDVSLPQLGLARDECELLGSCVSVVFHAAARIKFDRNVKETVNINVKGTRHVLDLCRGFPLLQALVYVSTAYIHPERRILGEEVYSSPIEPQKLIDAGDSMTPEQLDLFVDQFLVKCPNVYSFTKAVTEQLIRDESGHLPLVIVRPSIVTPAWKEPLPGWTDNVNGPSGGVAGALAGVIRVIKLNPASVADIVPLDYPINMIIAAAWHQATHKSKTISIYNCGTGHSNPITWRQFHYWTLKLTRKYPSDKLMWYPNTSVTANHFKYEAEALLFHYFPGYLLDAVAKCQGQRPRLIRLYDRAYQASQLIEFFACGEWIFHTDNMVKLNESMSAVDRHIFDCDVRRIDWPSYLEAYVRGIRQFILKESLSTLPSAKRKLVIFFWTHLLLRAIVVMTIIFCMRTIVRFA